MMVGMADRAAGIAEVFVRYADAAMRRFEGHHCRVRGSAVVHAVHAESWIGGIEVPAPTCHVGIGGWDLGALLPTDDPVTCVRCQRSTDGPAPPAEPTLW
jgi:hypothetical protein